MRVYSTATSAYQDIPRKVGEKPWKSNKKVLCPSCNAVILLSKHNNNVCLACGAITKRR